MADFLSAEMANDGAKPSIKRVGAAIGARTRRSISSFTLAAQAAGSRLMLPTVPKGARGVHHVITSSVSLATATLALGITGTTGKYRTAAVLTAVDTPESVKKAANMAAVLTADEVQFLTTAVAALPGAGTLVVETFYTLDV